MMSIGHRKLLFSQFNLHKNNRVVLVEKIATCSCYLLCPPKCQESPENYESSPPPQTKNNNMPTFLILMLCVLGAVFVFLFYLTACRRYRTNLNNSRRRISSSADGIIEEFLNEDHGLRLDHPIWHILSGLPQSVIDSIAVFKYKKGEGLMEGTDCSVCLSEFEDDESLRLLPKCSHAFHITCIDTWLRSHRNCPLCRAPIVCDTNMVSTDASQLNALQSGLDNSGSREDNSVDDHRSESDAVGEAGTSELRIGVENNGPLQNNEERKILEMMRRKSNDFTAGMNKARVLSDLADHRVRLEDEPELVRRSFSMDLPSDSMICAGVTKIPSVKDEGCSNIQDWEVKKQNLGIVAAKQGVKASSINRSRKSFSFGRSLQSVPIRMKRSFSSSGKFSTHRQSRSQELVQSL